MACGLVRGKGEHPVILSCLLVGRLLRARRTHDGDAIHLARERQRDLATALGSEDLRLRRKLLRRGSGIERNIHDLPEWVETGPLNFIDHRREPGRLENEVYRFGLRRAGAVRTSDLGDSGAGGAGDSSAGRRYRPDLHATGILHDLESVPISQFVPPYPPPK
jgi:hypothetical protein